MQVTVIYGAIVEGRIEKLCCSVCFVSVCPYVFMRALVVTDGRTR